MAGSISSLGIGSGVLTADVIDKLKEADEAKFVKPYDAKIELNTQKQESYGLVTTYMNTLKASASSLSYDTLFENKTVDITGDAKVEVSSGASVESFTLETVKLAKKEITQFGSLSSKDAKIASGSGVYTITVGAGTAGEKSYDIAYTDQTTLSQFAQDITDKAGTQVSVSILETSSGEFNLVLSSKETGADQALSFSDSDGSGGSGNINDEFKAYDATNNPDGYKEIQAAQDAEFKYNGIDVTRDTNTIDDLVLGLNITLTKEGDFSTVNVSQDNSDIVSEMESFVENYNTLIANLNDMTAFDEEAGTKGVFQGDSFIRSIRQDVTASVTQILRGDSLVNYGISISRDGSMSFNKSDFEDKLNDDTNAVKEFFTGGVDSSGNDIDGVFTLIDEKMKSYTGYGKMLSSYEDSLKTEATNLSKRRLSAQESLDIRYAIMEKRFAAYDSLISQANAGFSSVQMMINQSFK